MERSVVSGATSRVDTAVSFGIAVPTTFRTGMLDLLSLHSVAELQRLSRDLFKVKDPNDSKRSADISDAGSIGGVSAKEFPSAGLRSSLLGRRRPAMPPPRHASSAEGASILLQNGASRLSQQPKEEARRTGGYRAQPAVQHHAFPFDGELPRGLHDDSRPPSVAATPVVPDTPAADLSWNIGRELEHKGGGQLSARSAAGSVVLPLASRQSGGGARHRYDQSQGGISAGASVASGGTGTFTEGAGTAGGQGRGSRRGQWWIRRPASLPAALFPSGTTGSGTAEKKTGPEHDSIVRFIFQHALPDEAPEAAYSFVLRYVWQGVLQQYWRTLGTRLPSYKSNIRALIVSKWREQALEKVSRAEAAAKRPAFRDTFLRESIVPPPAAAAAAPGRGPGPGVVDPSSGAAGSVGGGTPRTARPGAPDSRKARMAQGTHAGDQARGAQGASSSPSHTGKPPSSRARETDHEVFQAVRQAMADLVAARNAAADGAVGDPGWLPPAEPPRGAADVRKHSASMRAGVSGAEAQLKDAERRVRVEKDFDGIYDFFDALSQLRRVEASWRAWLLVGAQVAGVRADEAERRADAMAAGIRQGGHGGQIGDGRALGRVGGQDQGGPQGDGASSSRHQSEAMGGVSAEMSVMPSSFLEAELEELHARRQQTRLQEGAGPGGEGGSSVDSGGLAGEAPADQSPSAEAHPATGTQGADHGQQGHNDTNQKKEEAWGSGQDSGDGAAEPRKAPA